MLWWLGVKILGVILILIGGFLVVFFPMVGEEQSIEQMGISVDIVGVVLGIILLIAGIFLVLS